MKKTRIGLLTTLPFLAIGSVSMLSGCTGKYDATLTVYNWEDYIYEGKDEDGNYVDDEGGICERFEAYYKEKTGLRVKVNYKKFGTNEFMYQQIQMGAIKADLVCPSDYMIQKMANDGMLEPFSYDESTDKYSESLSNWDKYGSPYIRERFASEKLKDGSSFLKYAVPYFWGTMGFTYDPEYFEYEDVSSWECLWSKDNKFQKQFSLKDSMRDTYLTGIFHVYREEILALDKDSETYTDDLSEIFNRCDDETIAKVGNALKEAKASTVKIFEVDEGKDEIVKGNIHANLAWSGDAVFSMDSAEESADEKILNYSLPEEGSNVWFDGWVMPKGAQKELAEEFVNFISAPKNAALCMDAVGYTSPIAGQAIFDLINDWYAYDEENDEGDTYEKDLSFFFGDTIIEEAVIVAPKSEIGRQFDAQYPTLEDLSRCCLMKDFGAQQEKVEAMWRSVRA